MKNIYVGNLPFNTSEDDLRQLFERYGEVTSARVIKDRETGRSRGFAFVEMPNDDQATAALAGVNGAEFGGRTLKVSEANRATRPPRT